MYTNMSKDEEIEFERRTLSDSIRRVRPQRVQLCKEIGGPMWRLWLVLPLFILLGVIGSILALGVFLGSIIYPPTVTSHIKYRHYPIVIEVCRQLPATGALPTNQS